MERGGRIAIVASLLLCAAGCGYAGSAVPFDAAELDHTPGWIAVRDVPVVRQAAMEDCGAAALAMIFRYWQVPVTGDDIAASGLIVAGRGASARDLRDLARKNGLHSFLFHGQWEDLQNEIAAGRPVIVGLVKRTSSGIVTHYEVAVAVHPERKLVVTHDPAQGPQKNSFGGFRQEWDPAGYLTLVFSRAEFPAPHSGDPR